MVAQARDEDNSKTSPPRSQEAKNDSPGEEVGAGCNGRYSGADQDHDEIRSKANNLTEGAHEARNLIANCKAGLERFAFTLLDFLCLCDEDWEIGVIANNAQAEKNVGEDKQPAADEVVRWIPQKDVGHGRSRTQHCGYDETNFAIVAIISDGPHNDEGNCLKDDADADGVSGELESRDRLPKKSWHIGPRNHAYFTCRCVPQQVTLSLEASSAIVLLCRHCILVQRAPVACSSEAHVEGHATIAIN